MMETGHLFSSLYFQRKRRQKIIQERLLLGKCVGQGLSTILSVTNWQLGCCLTKLRQKHNVCWYSKSIVSGTIIAVFWPQERTILLTREGALMPHFCSSNRLKGMSGSIKGRKFRFKRVQSNGCGLTFSLYLRTFLSVK